MHKPIAKVNESRDIGPVPYRADIPVSAASVSSDQFRRVMAVFPSAVAVVTAWDAEGNPRGLTCSAFCSLSMAPPTMLACVNRSNGSLTAIRESGGFAVNLLRAGSGPVSDVFASPSPDKFSRHPWQPAPESGLPWLYAHSLAYVGCRLTADLAAGSHAILVGLVTEAYTSDETGSEESDVLSTGPLVYWRRGYGGYLPPQGPAA